MSTNGQGLPTVVYQAQGMVSVQATCSMSEALALMQNTADATDETLESVAAEVVAHAVTFTPPSN